MAAAHDWFSNLWARDAKAPSPSSKPVIICVGDFEIETTARAVSLRGKQVVLSRSEFDLLLYLIAHPKKVVTSRTILSTHWSGQHVCREDFLRVLLSLRKKLEAAEPGQHYIRIEPWALYQFAPGNSKGELV